jgi:8-oxo-dGTP diphosphatase
MDSKERPLVGIGTLIYHQNKILLGKRINAHGNLSWAPTGGHLEFGESFEQAARRETLEETGLALGTIMQGPTINSLFAAEQKHYISIFMIGHYIGGIPEIREPQKCAGWQWFDVNNLPQPLFLPLQLLVDQQFDFAYYSTDNHFQRVAHL